MKSVALRIIILAAIYLGFSTCIPNANASTLNFSCFNLFAVEGLGPEVLNPNESTEAIVATLSDLLDRRILTADELSYFYVSLVDGQIINPLQTKSRFTDSTRAVYADTLSRILSDTQIQQTFVLSWTKAWLERHHQQFEARKNVKQETKTPYLPITFARVLTGEHVPQDPEDYYLSEDFYLSTTPVTQAQWVEVMGYNPSRFTEGPERIVVEVDGREVAMLPDHPVENITWCSALVFLNRLSELHGYEPVYNIDHIRFAPPDRVAVNMVDHPNEVFRYAALGGLVTHRISWPKLNKPSFHSLDDDSPETNSTTTQNGSEIYFAEGFRLPTIYEHHLVRMYLKWNKDSPIHRRVFWNVEEHAIYGRKTTHAVAYLRPVLTAAGDALYDLMGNVAEFAHAAGDRVLESTLNPSGHWSNLDDDVVAVGGSYRSDRESLRLGTSNLDLSHSSSRPDTGFRIARAIGPNRKVELPKPPKYRVAK